MNAKFMDIQAAANLLGPGAVEVPFYPSEVADLVRRRGLFSQRIKQVPATGHPSRFFDGYPNRVERSVPLKALVAQINYNLFDLELSKQQTQFAYLHAKDLLDTVDGVLRTHDVALWEGTDTSLTSPTTEQYFGAAAQIAADPRARKVVIPGASIVDELKNTVAEMVSKSQGSRPTAIYANPVLLDLIDREMKLDFNVVLTTKELMSGFTVKVLNTQAGDLPLIPEWTLPSTSVGTSGIGSTILPAYIVTEDLIEYHWLSDPNPRIFQRSVPGSDASQYAVVKFGGLVVKGADYAHAQVLVSR